MSKLEFKQLNHKTRFKERKFRFTQNQVDFLKTALDDETKLMFLSGPCWDRKDVYGCILRFATHDGL
jgi:hypothetical protein